MRNTSWRRAAADELFDEGVGIVQSGIVDDECVEIVMIVLAFGIVMRRTCGESSSAPRACQADTSASIAPSRAGAIFTARGKLPRSPREARRVGRRRQRSVLFRTTRSAQRADPRRPPRTDCRDRATDRFSAARRRAPGRRRNGPRRRPRRQPPRQPRRPSSLVRNSGQSNAFISGFGSARPEVSMTM